MGARWPPVELPGLHVRMLARPPTADYRCACCPHTDAASGGAADMAALTQRIEHHRTTCTAREEGQ